MEFSLDRFAQDLRSISPVVGVVLMVSITVALAAIIAVFVIGVGSNQSAPTQAGVTIQEQSDGSLRIIPISMNNVDKLIVQSNGTILTNVTSPKPVEVIPDGKVTIVAVHEGKRTVVRSYSPSSPTVVTAGSSEFVAQENLVARYKLESPGDDVAEDATGNGYNGTVYRSGITSADGIDGGAYAFSDQEGNRTEYPEINFSKQGAFTMSIWATSPTPGDHVETVVTHKNKGNARIRFTSGELRLSIRDGSSGSWVLVGSKSVNASTWYHASLTWNGSTAVAYINGSAVGTASISELYIGSHPNGIGADKASTTWKRPHDGRADDYRIYNTSLSSSQVQNLYNITK